MKGDRKRDSRESGSLTNKMDRPARRLFVKPTLTRHERLHQVARFGQASSVAGLQTVGVAS